MIADATLRRFGVRDRVKIIASGKLFSPDRIAVALAMGADLIQIARGFSDRRRLYPGPQVPFQ